MIMHLRPDLRLLGQLGDLGCLAVYLCRHLTMTTFALTLDLLVYYLHIPILILRPVLRQRRYSKHCMFFWRAKLVKLLSFNLLLLRLSDADIRIQVLQAREIVLGCINLLIALVFDVSGLVGYLDLLYDLGVNLLVTVKLLLKIVLFILVLLG